MPKSLNERLDEETRPQPGFPKGRDGADVVRDALTAFFFSPTQTAKAPKNLRGEVKEAVAEAIREQRESETLPVRLRETDRERLELIAEAIGYTEPQHLVEDIVRKLLRRPEDIKEMLLGRMFSELEAALAAEGKTDMVRAGRQAERELDEKLAVGKTTAKKPARKAA